MLAGVSLPSVPEPVSAEERLRVLQELESTLAAAVITFHVHLELGLRDVASSLGRSAGRRAMRRADEVAKHVEYLRTQLAELPAVSH